MFPAEVLLDPGEVPKSPGRVVVNTGLFRAYVDFLFYLIFVSPLLEFPWKIVSSSVELQILVPLETFLADFTDESVGSHECFW